MRKKRLRKLIRIHMRNRLIVKSTTANLLSKVKNYTNKQIISVNRSPTGKLMKKIPSSSMCRHLRGHSNHQLMTFSSLINLQKVLEKWDCLSFRKWIVRVWSLLVPCLLTLERSRHNLRLGRETVLLQLLEFQIVLKTRSSQQKLTTINMTRNLAVWSQFRTNSPCQ